MAKKTKKQKILGFFIKLFIVLFILVLISIAGLYFGYNHIKKWGDTSLFVKSPTIVDLKKGTSLREFSEILNSKDVVSSKLKFELWVRFFSDYSKFQAGPYLFYKKVSPKKLASRIIKGDVYRPILYKITVPEGFTYKQFSERVKADGISGAKELDALFTDKEFLEQLNVPSTNFEGFIFPATYSFLKKPTAREIVKKAVNTFWSKLPLDFNQDLEEKNLTLLEGITFASLIELETAQKEEKPMVAEVIWRRLKANMPLGIDASLIYGIKDYNGNISAKHLADADNPYNTKIHKGLPPGPIASPALDSIMAVLHPTNLGNYYFVVDPDNPKHHVFSKNINEHNKNVKKYVSAIKAARRAEREKKAEAKAKAEE